MLEEEEEEEEEEEDCGFVLSLQHTTLWSVDFVYCGTGLLDQLWLSWEGFGMALRERGVFMV